MLSYPSAANRAFKILLIFLLGGQTTQTVIGDDRSFTNALTGVSTVPLCHTFVSWLKIKSPLAAQAAWVIVFVQLTGEVLILGSALVMQTRTQKLTAEEEVLCFQQQPRS